MEPLSSSETNRCIPRRASEAAHWLATVEQLRHLLSNVYNSNPRLRSRAVTPGSLKPSLSIHLLHLRLALPA